MTAPNEDLQNITVAQFLAARAVKMTDDPNQLTLFAYESPEALVLVLRVRRAILQDRKHDRVLVAGEDPLRGIVS